MRRLPVTATSHGSELLVLRGGGRGDATLPGPCRLVVPEPPPRLPVPFGGSDHGGQPRIGGFRLRRYGDNAAA